MASRNRRLQITSRSVIEQLARIRPERPIPRQILEQNLLRRETGHGPLPPGVWDGEGWIPFAVLPDGTGIPVPFGIGLMMVGVTPLGVPGPAQTAEAVPPPTRKPLGRDAVHGEKAWTPAGP